MRHSSYTVCIRKRQHMGKCGEAAADREIGLDHIYAAFGNKVTKAISGEFALAPGDRNWVLSSHLPIALTIFGRHRLFEETDIEWLHHSAHPDCSRGVVAVIGINQETY